MPIFSNLLRRYGLSGNYTSWKEALADSTGYSSELILKKTLIALLKVKKGEAVYERDSVLFNEVQYSWPVLSGLLWIAARHGGFLNVLDFGGSLGSTYYQNRAFLKNLSEHRWNIVEQPNHVKVGKEYFEDNILKFYPSIEECLKETKPNVILLSGVLQYLEYPYETLNKLLDIKCGCIIIDRTQFWNGYSDRLCVQKVPPSIYEASYPSWIFGRESFMYYITQNGFDVMAEWKGIDKMPAPIEVTCPGMILVRRRT